MNTRTSSFFDSYASEFSAIYGNENTLMNRVVNKTLRRSMKLRYLRTLAGCEPIHGASVLDIGCGPGHYSIALAQMGAGSVFGVDFADGMIKLATDNAAQAGMADRCKFELADFISYPFESSYDYIVVMGLMDYMSEPRKVVERLTGLTTKRAFFSFPVGTGVLAWQRRLRYKSRCELYMYDRKQLDSLFSGLPGVRDYKIEQLSRDYFVTVEMAK